MFKNIRRIVNFVPHGLFWKIRSQIVLSLFALIVELSSLLIVYRLLQSLSEGPGVGGDVFLFPGVNVGMSANNASAIVIFYLVIGLSIRLLAQLNLYKLMETLENSLAKRFYEDFFSREYVWHKTNNSSQFVKGVMQDANLITSGIYLAGINLLVYIGVIFGFLIVFLLIDFYVTGVVIVISFLVFSLLRWYSKHRLTYYGSVKAHSQNLRYRFLAESIGSLKEIYIGGPLNSYSEQFSKLTGEYTKAQRLFLNTSNVPTVGIESIVLLTMVFVGIYILGEGVDDSTFPQLMFGVIVATRVIPALNRSFQSVSQISFTWPIFEELDQTEIKRRSKPLTSRVDFRKSFVLDNVSFSYGESQIFSDVSLVVEKGERVLLTGASGSGKTTLIEIFSGLLYPTSGKIFIDDKVLIDSNISMWQKNISYIPQKVHIWDESVISNVIDPTPLEPADSAQLEAALEVTGLKKIFDDLNRPCGEDGCALSGGQRQRVGLARALASNTSVLILDEATNALDKASEDRILENIFKKFPSLTILMISHRIEYDIGFTRKIQMEIL
jgi:ATP-binding cassette, subfamily B, bacterial PglK